LIGRLWRRWRGELPELPAESWRQTRAAIPWAQRLDAERDLRWQHLTRIFLRQKTITPLAGLTLDDGQRLLLAALCCLPLLEYGKDGLRGWQQLLVYPGAFRVRYSYMDASGVLHEGDDDPIGEAWESGPLILSWADVQAELDEPDAGACVVVHEMAHKLDALDGLLDGAPPLPHRWRQEWARDFQRAYSDFCREVDKGVETAIDPYASEAPEEFFAVLSEYHFSAPAILQAEMPEIAAHLSRFYGAFPPN
jgi:Mlc titration factor MtfA (ptsG expression regulator)